MATKEKTVNRDLVVPVAGQIMAARLAVLRDPVEVDDGHLDALADLSVRVAMAIDAAVPRAEERLAAEAKAAEEAEKAAKAAEEAEKAAAAKAAAPKAKEPLPTL